MIKTINVKESPGSPIAVIMVVKIEKTENNKNPKTKILKGFPAVKNSFEYRNCIIFVLVPLIINVSGINKSNVYLNVRLIYFCVRSISLFELDIDTEGSNTPVKAVDKYHKGLAIFDAAV